MTKDTRWSTEFHEETMNRINELEAPGYTFPPAFTRRDWSMAIMAIIVSGILLVAGVSM